MKTIWKLTTGGRTEQESLEERKERAQDYINKLESKGYEVTIEEKPNHLEINYEPARDSTNTDTD